MYALITGSAKRLGKQSAIQLAKLGYDILLHFGQSKSEAETTAEEIISLGRQVRFWQADLSDPVQVQNGMNHFAEAKVFPQIVVHSASMFEGRRLLEDLAQPNHQEINAAMMQVNLMTPILIDQLFLNYWNDRQTDQDIKPKSDHTDRHIIYFLDQRVAQNQGQRHIYSITKKALTAHMEQMAVEYGNLVKVNAIAPGLILPPPGEDISHLEKLTHRTPIQTYGGGNDIARAFDYLINSTFVHGQIMYCDGGQHLLSE